MRQKSRSLDSTPKGRRSLMLMKFEAWIPSNLGNLNLGVSGVGCYKAGEEA